MAEKRLFHVTIKQNNFVDYEAFYEAHQVGHIRQDAGNRYVERGNHLVFVVEHQNLTKNPPEFYNRLDKALNQHNVKYEKVPGLGHRWEVQKNMYDPNKIDPDKLNQNAGERIVYFDEELEDGVTENTPLDGVNIAIPMSEETEHYHEQYADAYEGIVELTQAELDEHYARMEQGY